jgi:hypothetical protein
MKWLKDRLVADCSRWWKLASVWLAALAGALSAVIVANQGLALALIGYLPSGFGRTLVAVAIGMVVFVVPTITRLWKQGSGG